MSAVQLSLLVPDVTAVPVWSHEGDACGRCDGGLMYLVEPSEPCTCGHERCRCLAQGYARCDTCGALQQVFPREMVMAWASEGPSAA